MRSCTLRALILAASMTLGRAMAGMPDSPDLFHAPNRFLDHVWPAVAIPPSTVMVDSFENPEQTRTDWSMTGGTMASVNEHATEGAHALYVTFGGSASELCYRRGTPEWSGGKSELVESHYSQAVNFYDELCFDVFNPDEPRTLTLLWENRTQKRDFPLAHGANSLSITCAELIRNVYRSTSVTRTLRLTVSAGRLPVTLFIDNVHWKGPGLGAHLQKSALCFDFGVAEFVRPGFQLVTGKTLYMKDTGYGWERTNTWDTGSNDGTNRRFTDELLRDCVASIGSPFVLDVPDGRYRLHVVECATRWPMPLYDFAVSVDGGKPVVMRRAAQGMGDLVRWWYGRDQIDVEPDGDKWASYMARDYRLYEHEFDVRGGQTRLAFLSTTGRGHVSANFLIVYPVSETRKIEPELAALWRDLRFRFNDGPSVFATRDMARRMNLPGRHEDYLNPEARKWKLDKLAPTDQETQDGAMVFVRDPFEEVYPDTVPARGECGTVFCAGGSPGETESMAVGVFALRDLPDAALTVGPFSAPGVGPIELPAVDVRVVNCVYRMSGQQSHGDWRYTVLPWYLVKRPTVSIPARTTRRWWVNVTIPSGQVPGEYTATAVLKSGNRSVCRATLKLTVVPFALDPLPKAIEVGMTLPISGGAPPIDMQMLEYARSFCGVIGKDERFARLAAEAKDIYQRRMAAEFRLMAAVGINRVYVEAASAYGTQGVTLPADVATQIELFLFKDTAQDDTKAQTLAPLAPILKLADFSEEGMRRAAAKGARPVWGTPFPAWGYSCCHEESGIYRFGSGFLLWRVGAAGGIYGPWHSAWHEPYNMFDGHVGDWGSLCAPSSMDGIIPNSTVLLEGLREGIKDYRHLAMLERLAKEKAGSQAAREAEAYLADLRRRIQPRADFYFANVGGGGGWWNTWSQKEAAWKGTAFAIERRELVRLITLLNRNLLF